MALQLNYSLPDRMLHRLAFAAAPVQLAAADVERMLFAATYDGASGARPVFITSLPRAGTTLMLEALHLFPSLASHVYRDMPFVMAPVLWSRLSGAYRKPPELRERTHGDGMEIGYDSPEAFEEILWRTFWPEKFGPTRIGLWQASDEKPDARAFLAEHMKKIIALRRPARLHDGRYISKNNANVARLDLIARMFPDATVVLPVRKPLDHARSLLRQHVNFIEIHRQSRFARAYMADIGHYEFGDLHRPIAFPDFEPLTAGRDPLTIDYWLGYWIAAFQHVSGRLDKVIAVSYERACRDPHGTLTELCSRLDIPGEGTLSAAAALFRDAPASRGDDVEADPVLRERAEQLYGALVAEP